MKTKIQEQENNMGRPKMYQEMIDQDYLDALPEADREYIDAFNREYYKQETGKQSEADKNVVLRTGDAVKESQEKRNASNRDLFNLALQIPILSEELHAYDNGEIINYFKREDQTSISYRMKISEKSQVLGELLDEAVSDVTYADDKDEVRQILKLFVMNSLRVYNVARKLKRKDTKIKKDKRKQKRNK